MTVDIHLRLTPDLTAQARQSALLLGHFPLAKAPFVMPGDVWARIQAEQKWVIRTSFTRIKRWTGLSSDCSSPGCWHYDRLVEGRREIRDANIHLNLTHPKFKIHTVKNTYFQFFLSLVLKTIQYSNSLLSDRVTFLFVVVGQRWTWILLSLFRL